MMNSIFWDITPVVRRNSTDVLEENVAPPLLFQGDLLGTCFMQIFWLACFSTLKMEATFLSETSVDFQRSTRGYIPEDRTLNKYRSENLKS
jgi:hypothetical protein